MPTMLQRRIDDQPTISREMMREARQILYRHLKRVGLKHTTQLEREIGRTYHYETTRHTFQIYGRCEDCRRKKGSHSLA